MPCSVCLLCAVPTPMSPSKMSTPSETGSQDSVDGGTAGRYAALWLPWEHQNNTQIYSREPRVTLSVYPLVLIFVTSDLLIRKN